MVAHAFVPNWYTLAGLRIPLGMHFPFNLPISSLIISKNRCIRGGPLPRLCLLDQLLCEHIARSYFWALTNQLTNFTPQYPRYETQKRISAFYLSGASVSGFGNIIAYGFSTVSPAGDLAPWQWIFLGMGLLTIASSLFGYAFTPNFPEKATFLSPVEQQLLQDRINTDRRDFENEKLTAAGVLKQLASPKVWAMGLLFLCSSTSLQTYT